MSKTLIKLVKPYYDQPHRFYHTIEHIETMFDYANQLRWILTPAQQIAIAFHDIVWIPGNDPQSVALSCEMINVFAARGFLDQYFIEQKSTDKYQQIEYAKMIVAATNGHVSSYGVAQTVIDLDLMGFCQYFDSYMVNNTNIEKEFKHSSLDRDQWKDVWKKGRVQFLTKMLQREPFYYCLSHDNSDVAKQNIIRELQLLHDA